MGIETLYSAAHAAGFAMAADEAAFDDGGVHARLADAQRQDQRQAVWQPSQAVLVREVAEDRPDWVTLLLRLFGRRTSGRRPALTAEA